MKERLGFSNDAWRAGVCALVESGVFIRSCVDGQSKHDYNVQPDEVRLAQILESFGLKEDAVAAFTGGSAVQKARVHCLRHPAGAE